MSSRTIITKKDVSQSLHSVDYYSDGVGSAAGGISTQLARTPSQIDTYQDRLIKFIPAEVIALYLTLERIIMNEADNTQSNTPVLTWLITGFLFVATPIYLLRVAKVKKKQQIFISTISFLVWVFFLGGPFKTLSWYQPVYGTLLLPAFTFLIPLFQPES